ncbi:carbohydrate ABC transporter permease [Paenibacillus alginolyticus]|uniref:Carbohydrate ABC transporter permease n=1 Tax=Paenibacillus alginolyticus TaxID=59839 RepID=A0ABT4G6D4_9BACL|nr:carbohydrate ABC transporter permease [Paenibacillus alginolyticus]MCY9667747.1 carbohydrate ABC transporter permease [Paenibacillus alginolyticus]MCY9691732.1 carbohydrate ABC transporter permease [Paenibacillus alginolyticus]MEC0144083.1 carbohydrate ABC transporter permease [Paenibacillus alginolyticus]
MKRNYGYRLIKVAFLSVYLVVMVFPLYWIVITSLKPQKEIFSYPVHYWPEQFTLQNYINIFKLSKFNVYIANSLLVSISSALIVIVIAICSAYVLARFRFRGHKQIMLAFFVTQMLPGFIALAPLYMMMSNLHLLNQRISLILMYTVILIPFSTIMLRGFFQRIPSNLEEAAMIDGCSQLSALMRVIIPIMMPGISSMFIFAFVQNWNELFLAVMFIDNESLKTLPVAMNSFILKFNVDWGSMSAGTVLSVLPTILLFALAQRFIVEGLTQGAVKG